VLANLFNAELDGRSVTPHTARNWTLGKSTPKKEKLVLLAKLLYKSADQIDAGITVVQARFKQ
jgi:hypothetical protein